MEWIERLVAWISGLVSKTMADGPFKDLLLDGIIGGVGGVIVFLPNILILYAFISFMEDSGYMARVAFIMDKLMHRMGLHGKSFIPLVMGFGCNVPAIMSTNNRKQIKQTHNNTYKSVYQLFGKNTYICASVGAFFPDYGAWVFVSLYTLGIAIAVLTAKLMRKLVQGR